MRNLFIIFCAAAVFLSSCSGLPDEETIRVYARANEAYAQGKLADVIEILRGENNFPPALILRAKAEYFSGNPEKAEKSCRRVIKLRPSSMEANFYLARILYEGGDLSGAQAAAESMLAVNPQDIRALRLCAELAFESQKFDEAAAFLDRAAEYSAESALVLLDRARLQWVTGGQTRTALDDLRRARAMLPWDTPLLRSIENLEKTIMEAIK